jgi:hypothetical protein
LLSLEPPTVYWLLGLAGIGKSTIARTIAQFAHDKRVLGASFFFSRTGDSSLRTPDLVFFTLAYQLARFSPIIAEEIHSAWKATPELVDQPLSEQIVPLLKNPLLKFAESEGENHDKHLLIVLDALDECDEGRAPGTLIRLLLKHLSDLPFCIRILVTSRPEKYIEDVFRTESTHGEIVLHNIEESVVAGDIEHYLRHELGRVHEKLNLTPVEGWPKEVDIEQLVKRSGKLFIYSATVIRWISDRSVNDPCEMLSAILDQTHTDVTMSKYEQLDSLYLNILQRMANTGAARLILEHYREVIGAVRFLCDPLSLGDLAAFLTRSRNNPLTQSQVENILRHLRSVIIYPSDASQTPRIFHQSFADFLTIQERQPGWLDGKPDLRFYLDPHERHAVLAVHCFEQMTVLKRNMADLPLPGSNRSDAGDRLDSVYPTELRYALRYWAVHVDSSGGTESAALVQHVDDFAKSKLMWWMEALCVLGESSLVISVLRTALTANVSNI